MNNSRCYCWRLCKNLFERCFHKNTFQHHVQSFGIIFEVHCWLRFALHLQMLLKVIRRDKIYSMVSNIYTVVKGDKICEERQFSYHLKCCCFSSIQGIILILFLCILVRMDGFFFARRWEFLQISCPRYRFYSIILTPDFYQSSWFVATKLLAFARADAVNYVLKVLTLVCFHISQLKRFHCHWKRPNLDMA